MNNQFYSQKPFLESISDENPSFYIDAFAALGLLYFCFGLCLWISPSVLSLFGPRISMAISVFSFSIWVASFFTENGLCIYGSSILNGMFTALLWTAQGSYIILNSSSKTVSRNASIFWVIYKSSLFCGNIFAFFVIKGKKRIDKFSRSIILYVLLACTVVAVLLMLALSKPEHKESRKVQNEKAGGKSFVKEFIKILKIAISPNMILISFMVCFIGIQVPIHSAVYSGSVGFTSQFGSDSKKLVPLIGMCIGVGEIISASIITFKGTKISQYKWGCVVVVTTGLLVEVTSFVLIFLNIPDSAVFGDTDENAYIQSNLWIALLCAVMIGFGDGCYTSQVFSLLEVMYPNDSPQTIALFNFMNSMAVAGAFYYSTVLGLHSQLIILLVMAVLGGTSYAIVNKRVR